MSTLAATFSGPSMWRFVWKLLRIRLLIMISGFRRQRLIRKILLGVAVLGFLAFLGFIFWISFVLLGFLRSPELANYVGDTSAFIEAIPTLIFSASFFGILLTSFGVLLQALYLAGDMEFLLAAPVPIRAVFLSKLLQAILPNFSLILLFSLPVLFGLGTSGGYNILYYPLVLVILALLALAAAGLSSLLVMVVVRVFPARRVAEVLGFVVGITSFICSQTGQFARYSNVNEQQALNTLRLAVQINTPWSPLAWAGRGLVALGEGRWLAGLGLLALILGLAGGIFYLSLVTSERLYYTGWTNLQGNARKKKAVRRASPAAEQRLAPLSALVERTLPSQVRGILVKDMRMLRRDLRNLSQLVTPLVLGVIYAFMLLRSGGVPPAGRGEAPEWFMSALSNAFIYGNVGISLFVTWSLLSRLAGMGFAQEGKQFWLIKTAPVSGRTQLLAKYLVAFLPTVTLGALFMVAISLLNRSSPAVLLYGLAVVVLSIAGLAGLNLAFGVLGANMEWEDPRYMVRGGIGCLGALASIAYLLLSLGAFFGPPLLLAGLGGSEQLGQLIGLLVGTLVSLVCAFLPLWLVREKVDALGTA